MTFQLDTSGAVVIPSNDEFKEPARGEFLWSDLSPFAQGYVEALFAGLGRSERGFPYLVRSDGAGVIVAFDMLHPEALALILRDCEDFYGAASAGPPDAIKGRMFWRFRNDGHYDRFPPLTPYLSDDGKVCLRGAT